MVIKKREYEDNSVIALLYDEYKRAYPETIESIQREIEALHEELYGTHLLNAEAVTAIIVGMGEDRVGVPTRLASKRACVWLLTWSWTV